MGKGKADQAAPPLIHYGICRVVVPSALVGTLFGVLINHTADERLILVMLAAILVFMAIFSVRTTVKQYTQERAELASAKDTPVDDVSKLAESGMGSGSPFMKKDVGGGVAMLATIVACSAL